MDLKSAEAIEDAVKALDVGIGATAQCCHLALARLADLATDLALGALCLELGQVSLELLGTRVDVSIATIGDLLLLDTELVLERRECLVATLDVDPRDHVRGEVDDLLEVLRCEIKQVAQATRNTLEVPDVSNRSGELDVTHALTTHLGASDLDATALADDALEAHALVLAAVALPVASRTEDLLAEESVLLGLEGAVVDGLRLLDLAV